MAEDKISKVMDLACCSRTEAIDALKKKDDVVDAVSLLMNVPTGRDAPKAHQLSVIQQFFKETREEMTNLTESISRGFISSSNQAVPSLQAEKQILLEETAQQNNCPVQYHPISPESTVQIPETACLLLSECSSCLQSSDQTSVCSHQGCLQ